MKLAVIADDLTGANDTGVQFAHYGARSAVIFQGEPLPDTTNLDVLVLDTDSRHSPPVEAAARVTQAVRAVADAPLLYKKIDSTLRGPIAAEVTAALQASGRDRAIIAPAFPRLGRFTRQGIQYLHDQPVHETEAARDPLAPILQSDLNEIFADIAGQSEILDAESDADLLAIVQRVTDPEKVLWVGTAGLAEAVRAIHFPGKTAPPARVPSKTVLYVGGSVSQVARAQAAYLSDQLDIPILSLSLEHPFAIVDELVRVLQNGQSVILTTPDLEAGQPQRPHAEQLANHLGQVVAKGLAQVKPDTLVLIGGDTASHVARALGAVGIRLRSELLPGVASGTLLGRTDFPVVTKAGAFGHTQTLSDIHTLLTGVKP